MKQRIRNMWCIIMIALLPFPVFAHGTEKEHQQEIMWSLYSVIGFVVLTIVLLMVWLYLKNKTRQLNNVKKQAERERRQKHKRNSNVLKWASILAITGVLISGWIYLTNQSSSTPEKMTMEHVHGLGYSGDGRQIFFAVHDGLRMYEDGQWLTAEGPKHDYMGFSMVDDGFYSSGHPAPGSNKKNPFGIVKSKDQGQTLEHLALYGEVDFHNMDVSEQTHTIFVMNPEPNEKMDSTGLYYSRDEAQTWIKSQMTGLDGEVTALAVHPTQDAMVAVGTRNGLYLSSNYGDQFEKIVSDRGITALSFGAQGQLFAGGYNNGASLLHVNMETEQQEEIMIPSLDEDAVLYFAQNPTNENEMVFVTYNKDVYLSEEAGASWTKIVGNGTEIHEEK